MRQPGRRPPLRSTRRPLSMTEGWRRSFDYHRPAASSFVRVAVCQQGPGSSRGSADEMHTAFLVLVVSAPAPRRTEACRPSAQPTMKTTGNSSPWPRSTFAARSVGPRVQGYRPPQPSAYLIDEPPHSPSPHVPPSTRARRRLSGSPRIAVPLELGSLRISVRATRPTASLLRGASSRLGRGHVGGGRVLFNDSYNNRCANANKKKKIFGTGRTPSCKSARYRTRGCAQSRRI